MRWKLAQFFENRWWRSYLKKQDPAEYLNWKTAYWREFLETLNLQPAPGAQVLDAGCGPAGVFTVLSNQTVTAIDPLLERYRAIPKFFRSDLYPWVSFRAGMLEVMREVERFDYVFCVNVINHVKDIDHALDRLGISVKPNGTWIMSIDCHNTAFFKSLFRLLPLDILHPYQRSLGEYQSAMEKRGFRIQQTHCLKKGFIFNYYVIIGEKG